jgi:hypothetical protein
LAGVEGLAPQGWGWGAMEQGAESVAGVGDGEPDWAPVWPLDWARVVAQARETAAARRVAARWRGAGIGFSLDARGGAREYPFSTGCLLFSARMAEVPASAP